jgi:hypothetical protein
MIERPAKSLEEREVVALARVRAAARDLKRAVFAAAMRGAREHPWALPSVGFCAGILAPFLVPDRRPAPEVSGHDRERRR